MCRFTFPEGVWKGLTGFGIGRIRWNRAGRGAGDALRRGQQGRGLRKRGRSRGVLRHRCQHRDQDRGASPKYETRGSEARAAGRGFRTGCPRAPLRWPACPRAARLSSIPRFPRPFRPLPVNPAPPTAFP